MPPSDLLRPRQGRQRRAEVGRDALLQETRPASRARRGRRRHRSRRRRSCADGRLGEVGRAPLLRLADVDLVIEREHDVVEDDVVAAAGAQAEMIPGLDDARARQARRHQKQSDARFGFIGPRPDRIPFQDRRARRIDLVAGQPPAGLGAPRDRRRQAAARGRAEFGLDAERVDQRDALDRLPRKLARQPGRPASGCAPSPDGGCSASTAPARSTDRPCR